MGLKVLQLPTSNHNCIQLYLLVSFTECIPFTIIFIIINCNKNDTTKTTNCKDNELFQSLNANDFTHQSIIH
eukprot:m.81447 g.81447  ORF g.81447 m.81447 type:complete len:72 (-) comp12057_c0_seq3:648-863(-)